MGTVTEVHVTYSRTVNLGNYESERLEVGQTSVVSPGETPETEIRTLITEARGIVQARLAEAAEGRRLARQRDWGPSGVPPRPTVDELDGEEDDPATGVG